jgi:hypothetical protein
VIGEIPRGTVLMLGVVGEHDSPEADDVLVTLMAWLAAFKAMPLVWGEIASDCMVAPVERGGVHIEVRWIKV